MQWWLNAVTKHAKILGETPLLEWLTGGLGAVVFCVMLGMLIATGVNGADAPPDVRISVERVSPVRGGYVVEFEAENAGDATAADVEITAELSSGESASLHFDYLAPHSSRRGGVFFRSDPRASDLSLRAEGYSDP